MAPLCAAADSRWPLGGIGVFPLAAPLSKALGGDIIAHLTVVAHLVGLGHVLETFLIASRQSLKAHKLTCNYLPMIQLFGEPNNKSDNVSQNMGPIHVMLQPSSFAAKDWGMIGCRQV